MLVHRPGNKTADYQCLFPVDNEEFKIVISNLTDLGGIKIDIGRKNVSVNETDPGSAKGYLNDVNELTPFQTYEILGDQKNSLAFMIKTIWDNGRKIPVEEAEGSKKGTFYYVSVVPRGNNSALKKLFEDAFWNLPEFITIQSHEIVQAHRVLEGGSIVQASSVQMLSSMESRPLNKSRSFGFAAEVAGGRRVDTTGTSTGFTYAYDVSSNVTGKLCCVSLSILENLALRDELTDNEIIALAKADIEKEMEDVQVFKEENCIVCLEEGNDAIIYRCGHQCMHLTCLGGQTRCPMCRAPIRATIAAALAPV
jgi:hypothetical protein